jgi:hypothetical protein
MAAGANVAGGLSACRLKNSVTYLEFPSEFRRRDLTEQHALFDRPNGRLRPEEAGHIPVNRPDGIE